MNREFRFNVIKDGRKALVTAIGEIMDCKPKYCGAPGFAFVVGDCTVSKDGTVTFEEPPEAVALENLLSQLAERGFAHEKEPDSDISINTVVDGIDVGIFTDSDAAFVEVVNNNADVLADTAVEDKMVADIASDAENYADDMPNGFDDSDNGDDGKLSIDMPLSGFTPTSISNLEKLVAAKAWIFKKMTGADELPIVRLEDRLCFPWFGKDASENEIDAYSRLIARLCETAKTKQRVIAEERPPEDGDNEKFKARCALLALGFIGREYAKARKILLAPMSGNGSFKTGNRKREGTQETVTTVDNSVVNGEAATVREDENNANNAATGGENAAYSYDPDLSDYDALMSGRRN